MDTTRWININTGRQLSLASLETLRCKARRAYEANLHLFEDEHDVLRAFGAVPAGELDHHLDLLGHPDHRRRRGVTPGTCARECPVGHPGQQVRPGGPNASCIDSAPPRLSPWNVMTETFGLLLLT